MPLIISMVGVRVASLGKRRGRTPVAARNPGYFLLVLVAALWGLAAGTLDCEEVWVMGQTERRVEYLSGLFTGRNACDNWPEERRIPHLDYWGAYFITHGVNSLFVECT